MLQLTDDQQRVIERLGAPLPRAERQRYWKRVRELLANYSEIGDGLINRAAAAAQREVMTTPPPRAHLGSKWSRHAGTK